MRKENTACLLHSYLADRESKDKPDRLTRLVLLAASKLYKEGRIGKICITVEQELSEPQANRIKTLLNSSLEEEDLVVDAGTVTTREEIEKFKELADEKGWENLITIGNSAHIPRIEREVKRVFSEGGVETVSADQILFENPIFSSLLGDIKDWPEYKFLALQEKILNTPVLGDGLVKLAPLLSHLKVVLQYNTAKIFEKRV